MNDDQASQLEFDLNPGTLPVTLRKPDGSDDVLELREMKAAVRDKYLDGLRGRMTLGADGKASGLKKFEGLQAELITRCLFRDGKNVSEEEIQTWPSSVVQGIYTAAAKLNNIGEDAKKAAEQAKNE